VTPDRPAARPALRSPRTASRVLVASLLVAAALAVPRHAQADDALARQYFRHGVELYDRKQYQPALEQFQKAYGEKPSPGIKQNVALCLKGLGRPVEAATAFDEALDEGQGTLKPEVRAAMEQELEGLSKIVATVRLKVISSVDQKAVDDVVVSVDGTPLSAAALKRPVRLEPGIHVFTAHAERLADPPEKKLSILAGSPVDATFQLGAAVGTLTITPSVPNAVVKVDNATVAAGSFPLRLAAGKHHVAVSAPGYQTATADVVVSPGAAVEYPIALMKPGELPPAYDGPVRPPPPPLKTRYIVPTLAYEGQSLRLSPVLGERGGGAKRTFTGASVGLRGGYRLSRYIAIELHGVVGQVGSTYRTSDKAPADSSTKVLHWQLTPGLRLTTGGGIRFTTGVGAGLSGLSVSSEITTSDGTTPLSRSIDGSGVAGSLLGDIGLQLDVGSIFLEAVGFFDLHGVGTTRDDVTNQRLFFSSPSIRGGGRIGLGIQF
jgi:PEGA domain